MELHADDGERLVTNGHDFPVAARCIGPGAHDEVARQRVGPDYKAVIARRGERIGQAAKNALAVMLDFVRLAVHQPFGPHDHAAGGLTDRLMAKTDAEDRQLAEKSLDAFDRNAGFARRAGTGRDNQVAGLFGGDLVASNLIITMDLDFDRRVDFTQPLDEVVGERVVVVDEQDHRAKIGGQEVRASSYWKSPPASPPWDVPIAFQATKLKLLATKLMWPSQNAACTPLGCRLRV